MKLDKEQSIAVFYGVMPDRFLVNQLIIALPTVTASLRNSVHEKLLLASARSA